MERIRGKSRLDLGIDPPPDIMVEIDIAGPSLNQLPIYAALGVPEVWGYDGRAVRMSRLEEGRFVGVPQSAALPPLTASALSDFLAKSKTGKRTELLRGFRDWLLHRNQGTS